MGNLQRNWPLGSYDLYSQQRGDLTSDSLMGQKQESIVLNHEAFNFANTAITAYVRLRQTCVWFMSCEARTGLGFLLKEQRIMKESVSRANAESTLTTERFTRTDNRTHI